MDRRALFDSAYKLAEPCLRDGFRFVALRWYVNADGAEVYAKLTLHREQTAEYLALHMVPGESAHALLEEAPDGLPPYMLPTLLARGGEAVLVVAEEAVADCFAGRGVLVTTGGPDTDWSSLKGRQALAWAEGVVDHEWLQATVAAIESAGAAVGVVDDDVLGGPAEWLAAHTAPLPPELVQPKPLPPPQRPQERIDAAKAPDNIVPDQEEPPAAVMASRRSIREATEFLRTALGNTERLASEIREEAELAGLRWRTVQAAGKRVGVERTKLGMSGGWTWRAPEGADGRDWKAHEGADGQNSKAHEGARTCTVVIGESEAETVGETVGKTVDGVRESVLTNHQSAGKCAESVHETGQSGVDQNCPGNYPAPEANPAGDLVGLAVAELASNPGKTYDIRARWKNGSGLLVVAARSGSEEIETTSLQVRCGEEALQSAFDRIGGPGRAKFEQRADQISGLLGRAQALAHAAVAVLSSADSPTAR